MQCFRSSLSILQYLEAAGQELFSSTVQSLVDCGVGIYPDGYTASPKT